MFNFPAVSGCFGVKKHWIAAISGPLMMKPAQNDCKIIREIAEGPEPFSL